MQNILFLALIILVIVYFAIINNNLKRYRRQHKRENVPASNKHQTAYEVFLRALNEDGLSVYVNAVPYERFDALLRKTPDIADEHGALLMRTPDILKLLNPRVTWEDINHDQEMHIKCTDDRNRITVDNAKNQYVLRKIIIAVMILIFIIILSLMFFSK